MINKIRAAMNDARKAGQSERTKTLAMVLAVLQTNETSPRKEPELTVVLQYRKKLQESLDLIRDEQKITVIKQEMAIVNEFLPAEPTAEEIENVCAQLKLDFPEPKQLGTRIKAAKEKFPTADGKLLSTLLK